ncbi:MAG: energy transducer TonB [Acidobacteriota bacterium]|nr:energy transducer TonB [Blastocatellia bacterium]MDW8241423.1 energy transducer TonB [Acidobacteriota bacterium]
MRWWLAALLSLSWFCEVKPAASQSRLIWAVADVCFESHPFGRAVAEALRQSLQRSSSVQLLDASLTQAATRGLGYTGSLNLSLAEARDLAMAIGCDYLILGRAGLSPHSPAAGQLAHRAWLGLFIVQSRTGRLAIFEFFEQTRATPVEAANAVLDELRARLAQYIEQVGHRQLELSPQDQTTLIEVNDPEKPTPPLFDPPRILASVKPVFTRAAQIADVTATVQLHVTFGADGTMGPITITRWAGFGLDQAAIEAAQRMRFVPARLNGQRVTAGALIQYKFKAADKESHQPAEESPKRAPSAFSARP